MRAYDAVHHPQPLVRRPVELLDGEWEFTADRDAAMALGSVPFADRIRVPFAPETPASGLALDGPVRRAWYRRPLPAAAPGVRTLLHLGAVDRIADVWVGGQHVARHEGGWTPWSVDVTDQLGDTGADLVVRAEDDERDLDAPRGKQEWQQEPHAIWYPRTTGIWRTVWLEQAPAVRIEDVRWSAEPRTTTVTATVRMSPDAVGSRLRIRLSAAGRVLVDDDVLVTRPEMTRTFALGDGGVDDRVALLWWPDRPVLVDGALALVDPRGQVVDEVDTYTALRSVRVEDGRFLLNDRAVRTRMVLDQGYWPSTGLTPPDGDALRRDLELTRSLGFHGARKHQKTEDPRYLAWADRLGMLVWAEMPSAYRPGDVSARRLLAEWADVVVAHRGHPSVVAWVPTNESWGAPEAEHDPRQAELAHALAAVAGALDGTRPVSANDGWETSGGQLLGVHDYEQSPERLAARYADADALSRRLAARRSDGRLADLDRAPAGGRAVVLSEFGGISLGAPDELVTDPLGATSSTAAWGYGNAGTPGELLERYRAMWRAVHDSEVLAGACWTQLTDTYQEVNGLLRADRTPKVDPELLAAATRGR
ncbi:glycoside hydrolase family 2 [Blastococcus sp. TF02-09]|uniref:glycoside hydrolase family 2 protein n=1 Tax=Blastococcus sp. TF02-09 TaxID=2250576 RepID=UPI000DEA5F5B|nr:glycoside hydrolase family 2 TIM barrel-domain containing protein [Blastococcus sp. TF02-9]RBY78417.1 glycoside hydrolase family 2 [Blastococcus sp. TF02-9]